MSKSQTNAEIRDDLDNYGGHMQVVIEENSGRVRTVGAIRTADFGNGLVIVIEAGDKYLD